MADYRKLKVWAKAHELALEANKLATSIRSSRHSALRSQLIRAALSVPTNIVEGSAQESRKECARFFRYAINSASEAEYHCLLARDLGLIADSEHEEVTRRVAEVRRMLYGLLKKVTKAPSPADPQQSRSR